MLPIADIHSERFFKKLTGRNNIRDALRRLDNLEQEAQMAIAQAPKVAHNAKGGIEIDGDQVKDVSDQVNDIGDQVTGVSDQVQDVGDQVIDVDDKVKVVGDLVIEGTSGETYHFVLFLCFLFSFFFLSSIIVRPGA